MGKSPHIHGYIVVIGPANSPNYFTGCGYSVFLNKAKVFRARPGALWAEYTWHHADYNPSPIPQSWWSVRHTAPVTLHLEMD